MVSTSAPVRSAAVLNQENIKVSKDRGLSVFIARPHSDRHIVYTSEDDEDSDAQYVYVSANSPFFQRPAAPRTPVFLSFTGFAFACAALAEDDSKTPHELFDEELKSKVSLASPGVLNSRIRITKAHRSPGLSLNLGRQILQAKQHAIVRRRPKTADSATNTPGLDESFDSDSDSSDYDENDDAQYVYIPADSPFHTNLSTARTSACLSVSAFPFACDALAEEDPLFMMSPTELLNDELQYIAPFSGDKGAVVVVDPGSPGRGADTQITADIFSGENHKPASLGATNLYSSAQLL